MFIGIDSFAYHRYFGETSEWEPTTPIRWSTSDFLGRASDLGVAAVSLQTVYLPDPNKRLLDPLKKELDRRKLDRIVAWGHRRGLVGGTDQTALTSMLGWIDGAASLGCKVVRIVCGDQYSSREPFAERRRGLVPMLRQAASRASEVGLELAIENHADLRSEELVTLIDDVGAPNLGVCLDSGNAVRLGEELLDCARRLGPLTLMVHIKDVKVLEKSRGNPTASWPSAPLGEGSLDIPGFISTLSQCGYDGGLFIEMTHMHPSWPDEDIAVADSVAYLRRSLPSRQRVKQRQEAPIASSSSGPVRSRSTWIPVKSTAKNIGAILRSRDLCPVRPESEPFIGGSILVLHGDEHFARRRLESSLFTSAALKDYEIRLLAPAIEAALESARAKNRGADGTVHVDLVPLTREILLHIAAEFIGLDIKEERSWQELSSHLERLIEGSTLEWTTRDLDEVRREALEHKEAFAREFVAPAKKRRVALIARWRAGELAESALPQDLLTKLLTSPHSFDDEMILRECVLYLVASTQTSSNAATHTIIELDEWFRSHPEDLEHRLDSDFLRKAGMEGLRLHPSSPSIVRVALTDITLPSGEQVSAGQIVAPDVVAANRDPVLFGEDAGTFNPRRETSYHLYGYAFGSGVHVCIGQPLVLGTHTPEEDRGEVEGILVRVLKALYRSGVTPDPYRPRIWADSGRDIYASFPVLLTSL